ncbi:MAG: aminotransferase class I/II-fold pyridoxal phosphate-dependent enzyme [Spirochaetales bacterium]|nr:aminotransferase class I/II-fold pyridoxal phosphate-dependent enzyme [Spirochaetales bacterium]
MNELAIGLNEILKGTAAFELLSDYGKRMFFPVNGIVAQSGEAAQLAKRYNATVGMAVSNRTPIEHSAVKAMLPGLTPAETVSYAPSPGVLALRNKWKEEIYRKNPGLNGVELSLPLVVPGLTGGISQIGDFFLEKGKKIVIPNMYWENYDLIFTEKNEADVVLFEFFSENGGLNVDGLLKCMEESAVDGKVYVILNFPNNPTGYSPSCEEVAKVKAGFKALAQKGLKILAIVDDAYFGLFYEEETYKQSIFAELASLDENILAVKVDGPTKEHFVWGFRVGFVTFGGAGLSDKQYDAIAKKVAGGLRGVFSNSSMPAQNILLKALNSEGYEAERASYDALLKERYHKVKEVIAKRTTGKALTPQPFNSGYFMNFVVDGSAEELRKKLLQDYGIGTICLQEKYLRVAFSSVDVENIEDLYNCIFEAADKLFD